MRDLYLNFDQVFFEKNRLSMITLLFEEGEVSYNRFKKIIGGTDGAIYAHLKKLLQAGYIRKKKQIINDSAQTVYSLTEKGTKAFQEYMDFIETIIKEHKGERTDEN